MDLLEIYMIQPVSSQFKDCIVVCTAARCQKTDGVTFLGVIVL